MTSAPDRDYTYREFSDFVRRFDQEALLAAIAQRALSLPSHLTGDRGSRYRETPPWALAAVAKASICHGNAYRRQLPQDRDVLMACHMHNRLDPEELAEPSLNSPFAILARTLYEQFPYQESVFEELARPMAFFDDYSGRDTLEVVSTESLQDLIGAPMKTAAAIAMMLATSAQLSSGLFEPAWLEQENFSKLLTIMPRDEILAVVDSIFAGSMSWFRQQDTVASARVPLPYLDRYAFNPLTSRPFVRLSGNRLLAPVPQLIARRLSPLELYYTGLQRWGSAFTSDMGELFEDYLGRQFATLPNVSVHPEIAYKERRQELKSIDWFVVFDDMVVLVEAKATRSPLGARAADTSSQRAYTATLGDAFKQLGRTMEKIRAGLPEFAHIPIDRPIVGMVATLDPWYIANSFGRAFLPTPALPTVVASVRDIEHLVGIGQRRPASTVLAEIMRAGDERQTWELGVALNQFHEPADRNPILDQAWSRLPFATETAAATD
ncbi:hypothetical protein [Micromonospora arborensis]|uniref:hypothetical protein n=1 Tax=Micromonospora arborensis TaxID=2116518 RepID=UPI0037102DFC